MTVIPDQSDSSLLQEFAAHRSQDAFAALVSRHSNWVYSAAARMVGDPHLAEDIAQAVFLILANKAGKIGAVPFHRWLFKVTRYACANATRARTRRDKHERHAAMLTSEIQKPDPDSIWQEIAPALDDALGRLRSKDRDALVLRFYQQKDPAEVAAALGVSEGAAKIRIFRALEKLRAVLRRRGIVIPSADLSAALLVHTTSAAPSGIVTACLSASTSINATAIAKGVSNMMTLAKIKLAAALILLCAIPVAAGALFLADSAPAPSPAPQQTEAQVAAAAQPSAANAAASGLDPRVAPFVTNRTDIIIQVDLTAIDLDALAADMRKELQQTSMDAASAAHVNELIQMGLDAGGKWINDFARAGGTTMFVVAGADQLVIPSAAGNSSLHFNHATIVFPTDSNAAAQNLAEFLTSPGSGPLAIVGNAVVANPPTAQPSTRPDPRPALAAGLSAAGDATVRAAINPAELNAIIPQLLASGNVPMTFTDNEWAGVESATIRLALPPAEPPVFSVISRYKDPASAEIGRTKAVRRIDRALKQHSAADTPLGRRMLKFMRTEKFTVKDSNLVATMDLHAYWDLLFAAVNIGQPHAAQPPSPAN
jgi:RNA polymerase sigma factor (sigma-70 family)